MLSILAVTNAFFASQYAPTTNATLIATDGAAFSGTGEMALQVPASYADLATQGGYAIDLRGERACTECSKYGHEAGAVHLAGQLFLEYPPAAGAGLQVLATEGGSVSGLTFLPAAFTEMSLDSHATSILLSGKALQR